jgi:hypothetical protein
MLHSDGNFKYNFNVPVSKNPGEEYPSIISPPVSLTVFRLNTSPGSFFAHFCKTGHVGRQNALLSAIQTSIWEPPTVKVKRRY